MKNIPIFSPTENILIEVLRYIGPPPSGCNNCKTSKKKSLRPYNDCTVCYEGITLEVKEALQVIHKYFGKRKTAYIYSKILKYNYKPL